MIPRFRPTLLFSDLRVLFEKKPSIVDFENAFAEYSGWRYSILFPYGHAAACSFFMANGIKGKEIIMPAYNCRVMLSSVIWSGNRPVFVDCEEEGVNMDSDKAVSLINQNTGAVIPTAMYGYPFDINAYKDLPEGILVLADLAHNLLDDPENLERYREFDAAIFSFGIGKQTTMLGGGILCTDNPAIYQKVKEYRDHNFTQTADGQFVVILNFIAYRILFSPLFYRFLFFFSEKTKLLDSLIGFDIGVTKVLPDDFYSMPTSFQIGLGLRQLGRIQLLKEKRRALARRYDRALQSGELKRIEVLPETPNRSHYPIFSDDYSELSERLISEGIHAPNIFEHPIYDLPIAKDFKEKGGYPNADNRSRRCLLLPLYDLLTEAEQDHIIRTLLKWDGGG